MAQTKDNTAYNIDAQTENTSSNFDVTRQSVSGMYVNAHNEVISWAAIAGLLTIVALAGYSLIF